jgi:prepilin-type N-terminal cleavage/methylation domain-containing protein
MIMSASTRHRAGDRGFSLIELLIAMGLTTVVMGVTMAGLSDAMRANDMVVNITTMNNGLRLAMDLMVRDLLQTGSGLGKAHQIQIPSGGTLIRRPGPPAPAPIYTRPAGELAIPAVIPGPGLGPTINGVATDIITILTADNNFTDVRLSAVANTWVEVTAATNIATGVDRVIAGQLMMVTKGTATTLMQVTGIVPASRRIQFDADSLNLNQSGTGIVGSMGVLNALAPPLATAPAAAALNTRITRVRMISYYLDNTTTPGSPRLVRRINNGHATSFNNNLGTAVAIDIENLTFSYDINDGDANPSNVRFVTVDLTGAGPCTPDPCAPTQIRKINVTMTARSQNVNQPKARVFRNTLNSQVALRGMALVNDYQ